MATDEPAHTRSTQAWHQWAEASAKSAFPLAVVEFDGTFVIANPAFESLVLEVVARLKGRNLAEFWDVADVFARGDLPDHLRDEVAISIDAGAARGATVAAACLRLVPIGGLDETAAQVGVQVVSPTMVEHGRDVVTRREEAFRQAFEGTEVGMILLGLDGRVLDVNDAMGRLLARTRDDLLTFDAFALTHPDDRPDDITYGVRALAGESAGWTRVKRLSVGDGSWRWMIETVTLVRGARGEPLYFFNHLLDLASVERPAQLRAALAEVGAPPAAGSPPPS